MAPRSFLSSSSPSSSSTAARLRKTFKYPTDNDSDDEGNGDREVLDEQEQEELISSLRGQEESTNAFYVDVFTVLPVATVPAYLFCLLGSDAGFSGMKVLLSLLSITSLLASSFIMWFTPVSRSLDELVGGSGGRGTEGSRTVGQERGKRYIVKVRRVPVLDIELDEEGPLGRALPYLNVAICAMLAWAGWLLKNRAAKKAAAAGGGYSDEIFCMLLFLPAVMQGMVLIARQSMKEVAEGINELGTLRYRYKGA